MPQIKGPVVRSPTPELGELHLIMRIASPIGESYFYIPESEAPGLTIDVLRIDIYKAEQLHVEQQFALTLAQKQIVAQEAEYGGPERFCASEFCSSENERVFHTHFEGHPVVGARDVVSLIRRVGDQLMMAQIIRKIEPPCPGEVAARAAFLQTAHVDVDALRAAPVAETAFARACLEATRKLAALHEHHLEMKSYISEPAEVLDLLSRASLLHSLGIWALLAFQAVDVALENPRIEEFAKFRRILGLAAVTFDDIVADGAPDSLQRMLLRCLDMLARLLLWDPDTAQQAKRAAEIWQMCGARCTALDLGSQAAYAAKSAFASAIAAIDLNSPLDVDLKPAVEAIKANANDIGDVVETLDRLSNNMAYVGRRIKNGRPLLSVACVAADIAQILLEYAVTKENFFTEEMKHGEGFEKSPLGLSAVVSQQQLDAQSTLYGVDRQAWEAMMEEGSAATLIAQDQGREPLKLFYMRPLRSARRILVRNRFPHANPYFPIDFPTTFRLLPELISIEAALHWALCRSFRTEALGGPIDLFGMGRSTILSVDPDDWKKAAMIKIISADILCVMPAETEGLSWELGLIREIGANDRTLFVLPPETHGSAARISVAERRMLHDLGFDLPERIEPGFLMFTPQGACDMQMPFESLWDGNLRQALHRRLSGSRHRTDRNIR